MDIQKNGNNAFFVRNDEIFSAVTGRIAKNITYTDDGAIVSDATTGREEFFIPYFKQSGGSADTSDATAIPSDVSAGVTFYGSDGKKTGTMPDVTATASDNVVTVPAGRVRSEQTVTIAEAAAHTTSGNVVTVNKGYQSEQKQITVGTAKGAQTYTPGTSDQAIAAGTYLTGKQTIKGDSNLTAENIKAGVSVFNIAGSFTSDATAEATDILPGKTAYVNGQKFAGAMPVKAAETYTPGTEDITITDGVYLKGNQTIKGDSNLTAENIKEGVFIFGVEGAFAGSGSGGAAEFYKCFSTDVSAKIWSGYKAVMSNGVYTFEESVTEGLTFGSGYTPAPGFIYDSEATVMLSTLWSGIPQPADYDIYASFSTPSAEKGGIFTLERPSVDYGVVKNGILGANINDGIVSIPWSMSDDFTFSVRYKPLSGGENYYEGPLLRVGQDGTSTLYSIWVNMEWDWCMMHIEYGSGGTERFEVDTNHHIYTLVKSGDELKLYVDTELRTTDNHTCNVNDRSHIYIGGMGSYPAKGHYSDFRIYSRALTSEEIAIIVQQAANN